LKKRRYFHDFEGDRRIKRGITSVVKGERQVVVVGLNHFSKMADLEGMFEWSNAYSVGVNGIDSQHKNLFHLAAELHRGIVTRKSKAVLSDIVDRLLKLIVVHFAYEERLMQEAAYPDFQAHKLEHDDLRRKALQLEADFKEGNATSLELFQTLKDALQRHTLESDQRYAPYLKNKQE